MCVWVYVCVCIFYVCVFIRVFMYLSECPCACTGNMHVCVGAVCSQITMPLATIIHQRRSGKRRWHRSLTKNFLTILAQNSKIQITSDWKIRIKKQYHTDKQRGQSIILWLLSFLSISLCLFKYKRLNWTWQQCLSGCICFVNALFDQNRTLLPDLRSMMQREGEMHQKITQLKASLLEPPKSD